MSTPAESAARPDGFVGLNIGCGSNALAGWTNCDRSFCSIAFKLKRGLGLPRYRKFRGLACVGVDAKRRLPFGSGTVDAVYEQHMLYAFEADETRRFLAECYRVLRPGGRIRLNEDNLRTVVERYLAGDSALIDYAARAPHVRCSGVATAGDALSAILKAWRSLRWLYDVESLSAHLAEAGFTAVAGRDFRDSALPDIEVLEKDNTDSVLGQIWLEGVKPQAC